MRKKDVVRGSLFGALKDILHVAGEGAQLPTKIRLVESTLRLRTENPEMSSTMTRQRNFLLFRSVSPDSGLCLR